MDYHIKVLGTATFMSLLLTLEFRGLQPKPLTIIEFKQRDLLKVLQNSGEYYILKMCFLHSLLLVHFIVTKGFLRYCF